MDKEIINSIKRVLIVYLDEERKHWMENDKPKDHIYHDLKALDNSIRRRCCCRNMVYDIHIPTSNTISGNNGGFGCSYTCEVCGKQIVYEEINGMTEDELEDER